MKNSQTDLFCGRCRAKIGDLNTGKIETHACLEGYTQLSMDDDRNVFGEDNANENLNPNNRDNHLDAPILPTSSCSSNSGNVWTDAEVRALIETYKSNEKKFSSPLYNKKAVWEAISLELMNTYAINRSSSKCDEKWRNLKKNYDRIKAQNNTTGNARHNYKFFDQLQEVFQKNPQFHPVATASSSGHVVNRKETTICNEALGRAAAQPTKENTANKRSNDDKKPVGGKETKRAMTLREYEANKQQRHLERMGQKERAFEWLKNFLEKK